VLENNLICLEIDIRLLLSEGVLGHDEVHYEKVSKTKLDYGDKDQ
jgi:hypothetical protein